MRALVFVPLLAACASDVPTTKDTSDTQETADTTTEETGKTPDTDARAPDQEARAWRTQAGDFALDYLTEDVYTSIYVEIDHVAGHPPSQAGKDSIRDTLHALGIKSGGIEVVVDDVIPDQGAPAWSLKAASELERTHRDRYADPDKGEAVLYFLYLDGHSDRDNDDGSILGYAIRGSSLVMFPKTIDKLDPGLLSFASDPEATVAAHEVGHILGLVANGVEMVTPHRDEDHGAHDVSNDCIMHWSIETSQLADILLKQTPTFDDACLDDIAAAGGRTKAEARKRLSQSKGGLLP